jgi:hypothetical protein
MSNPLCIYHGNCADGFTSAWAVWKALGNAVEFFPGVYNDPPPDVTGRDIIMVDFSYKRPVLDAMAKTARSMLVLDHHKTAEADLEGFGDNLARYSGQLNWQRHLANVAQSEMENATGIHGYGSIFRLFDMEKSGAGLTWDFFHPETPRPDIVRYVEDRDLWRFKLVGSREVAALIFSYDYNFENWDRLAMLLDSPCGLTDAVAEGAAIERKHHKDVAELVRVTKRRMVIGGQEVWCANLPYTLTSDAGNLMAQGEPFAACYWDTPDGRVFSLRSTPEGADVSEIAKAYGGGGHRNASGFRLAHGVQP